MPNPEMPETSPYRDDFREDPIGPRYIYHESPSDRKQELVKELWGRFITSIEECPLIAMQIYDVRTLNGTIVPQKEWQQFFELAPNGTFTIKKFDTPVDHW